MAEKKADGPTMREGTRENWREDSDAVKESAPTPKEGAKTGATPDSSGSQVANAQRGTREDWWRQDEPIDKSETPNEAASSAGGLEEPDANNTHHPLERTTFRDGTPRD
jgi:hypothetical protein